MVRLPLVIGYCLLVIGGSAQDIQFEALNKLPSSINTSCEEVLPLVSPDGKTIYFVRASCGMNDGGASAGSDIWASDYNAQTKEWGRPKNTGIVFNDKGNNAVVGM